MNITEVRVKLMHHRSDRLRAFCSITIDDDFVVHDLRVIEGRKGLFVAMPSRKLRDSCPRCSAKNELRAKFCGECGAALPEDRESAASADRDKYHVDVAHPINTPCRELLQKIVLAAYEEELHRRPEGQEPLRQYDAEGLDELASDYDDLGGEPEPAEQAVVEDLSPVEAATEDEAPEEDLIDEGPSDYDLLLVEAGTEDDAPEEDVIDEAPSDYDLLLVEDLTAELGFEEDEPGLAELPAGEFAPEAWAEGPSAASAPDARPEAPAALDVVFVPDVEPTDFEEAPPLAEAPEEVTDEPEEDAPRPRRTGRRRRGGAFGEGVL